jgi:phytoene dehydrogenase-like protein
MCLGGSANLAHALIKDIREHGGEVITGLETKRILFRRGRVAGIELAGGETIGAKAFVASGLNPQQTFLQMLDSEAVSSEVQGKAAAFQFNTLAPLFALNLALDEPPRFSGAQQRPELIIIKRSW